MENDPIVVDLPNGTERDIFRPSSADRVPQPGSRKAGVLGGEHTMPDERICRTKIVIWKKQNHSSEPEPACLNWKFLKKVATLCNSSEPLTLII